MPQPVEKTRLDHVLVIANPVAGKHDPDETRTRIESELRDQGIRYEFRWTEGPGDARRWAREAVGHDAILAVGGDGTLAEVVNGRVESDDEAPIYFVPLGTANLVALSLGIPRDLEECVRALSTARARRLDVGWLPDLDRGFLLTLAVGIPAEIIVQTPREAKDRFGAAAYAWAAARAVWNSDAFDVTCVADGETTEHQAHTVLVTNLGRVEFAGQRVGPGGSPDDGELDVHVASGDMAHEIFAGFVEAVTGEAEGDRIEHLAGARIEITTEPVQSVQIDGEQIGETPIEIEVKPRAISVLLPTDDE